MPYPGGKAGAGVYQRIINQIPPHEVYVEPFLGDGAVLRRKRPAARSVGIEIDPDIAAGLAAESAGGGLVLDLASPVPTWQKAGAEVEVHQCCGIEWLKHAFGLHRLPRPLHPPAAAAVAGNGGVVPGWFVYCDPPYLLSTRRSGPIYRHELTEAQHVELLGVITRLPCPVAISGYWSPLYAETLQSWRSISFMAQTRGGRPAREHLWMNYPEPAELHDYRYLGGEKRERERIARKVRTWSAGLRRLPRLERQAIVDAITEGMRERREALRLSLHVVAKALGMSVSGLHAIDTGSDPQLTTARRIAAFFGTTIEELWPETVK